MAITLKEALENLPIFSEARVVAGHGGLDRVVRWAHIVDLPDVTPWVRQGDLLLTTAFALKDDPDAQVALIPRLAEKGLAGLLVALGTYFHDIPEAMIKCADHLDFPILTLPWEVPFVEVTQAIHEHVLRQQYAHIEKSLQIHEELTQLVLQGRSLEDIVESLARLLNRSVTIEDPGLRVLAQSSYGPVDEIRRRSINEGQTPRELYNHLEAQGLFEQLRKDPRPRHVPSLPEMGMIYERVIAPILVGSNLFGYVWIIAADSPLSDIDFLAIEQAAMVAALAFTRKQAIFDAEQRVKSDLLNNLLEFEPNQALRSLREIVRQLGLSNGYQAMAIEEAEEHPAGLMTLSGLIEREISIKERQGTVIQRANRLVVLLSASEGNSGQDLAEDLLACAERNGAALLIGIGTTCKDETKIRQSYNEAIESLRIGKSLSNGRPGVWRFEDLGFLRWFRDLPGDSFAESRYHRTIEQISRHDELHGDEYLRTLEAYLDFFGNKQNVAKALFIHRNTLRQRLEKLSQRWGINFEDSYGLANFYIAIKQKKLGRPNE